MKILVKTFILLGLVCFLMPNMGLAKTQVNSSYQDLRDYLYSLLAESQLDEVAFTQVVSTEAYGYNIVDKVQDFWHSLFFNNPRGSEVLYNDIEMSLAIGFARLGRPEDLIEPLQKIISRRLFMYHGTKNNNYYIREYAALASLAYLIDDERLPKLQTKVRQSVGKIYLTDGYAFEGPEYGLYSMSILSGYVYFTDDIKVKQKIISNINWLASISSADRYKPPFDDSLASLLPTKISAFPEVNFYWQSNFRFNNIPKENTYNKQETIWRYGDTTVWLRHREKNNEWQGLHRNYSNGDVLLKVDDLWWLVAPGYQGWEKKEARPEHHNIVMSKSFYPWRFFWRILMGGDIKLLYHEEGSMNKAIIQLNGKIIRTVESDNNSLVVSDKSKNNFKQFWQINGELVGQRQDGDIVSLQWRQGDQLLNQVISGVYKLSVESGIHTGKSKMDLVQHTRLIAEGKDIIVRFVW